MLKNNYDIVAAIHRLYVDGVRKKGGADKILEYFSKKGKKILLIEHPLCGLREKGINIDNFVIISEIIGGNIIEIERREIVRRGNWIRWISEVFFNIWLIYTKIDGKPVYFSADPLNNLAGIFSFGKFKFKYFHCVDYSRDRFGVINLNIIYQIAVFLSLKRFDLVSVVSNRTKKEFEKLGADESKIFLLPNSPNFRRIDIPETKKNILIYTSNSISERYNYIFVVELISQLVKDFPDIKLYALGGKNVDADYFDKVVRLIKKHNIEKNIIFKGFLKEDDINKLYFRSKIGLSFYSGVVSYYMIFGDSLKIREYALWGLPVVSDGNSATDSEMVSRGCGIIAKNVVEAKEAIKSLLISDDLYCQCRQNSLNWAKKMDKKALLKQVFQKVFSNER